MTRNSRALQLEANSTEFDEKLAKLKRLKAALESFAFAVCETASRQKHDQLKGMKTESVIDGDLHVITCYLNGQVRMTLTEKGTLILHDYQISLSLVRRVYANADMLIECAEAFCQAYDRGPEFRERLARFGM